MRLPGYKEFCEQQSCKSLVVLEQVHSTNGYVIQQEKDAAVTPYAIDGDYAVGTVPGVALALETADCVPLLLVDEAAGCVAAIHAGWRGAIHGVASHAVRDMVACGSAVETIRAYFGPSARACCYQVSPDWPPLASVTSYVDMRQGALYFDNVLFLISELRKLGIPAQAIMTDYATCTICSKEHCSFRKQVADLRQIAIVALGLRTI